MRNESKNKKLNIVFCKEYFDLEHNIYPDNDHLLVGFGTLSYRNTLLDNHFTLEEVIPRYKFKKIIDGFHLNLSNFLKLLDVFHTTDTKLFQSSSYWLSHRLSEYLYFSLIKNELDKKYTSYCLFVPYSLSNHKPDTAVPNFINSPSLHELRLSGNKLHYTFISMFSNSKVYVINDSPIFFDLKLSISSSCRKYFYGLLPFVSKKINSFTNLLKSKYSNKFILIAQSGYDVDALLKHIPIPYIYLLDQNLVDSEVIIDDYIDSKVKKEIDKFINTHFSFKTDYLTDFFVKNFQISLKTLSSIDKNILNFLKSNNILLTIYSVGIQNYLLERVAYLSAQSQIKNIVFKHSAFDNLFINHRAFNKFVEHNDRVNKFQAICCDIDGDNYTLYENIDVFHYADYKLLSKGKYNSFNNQLLYLSGPPNSHTFNDPAYFISDNSRSKFFKELARTSKILNLKLFVKPHPVQIHESLIFYQKMKQTYNFKLITGSKIEFILNSFSIVIIDVITTNLLNFLLNTNCRIITFYPKAVDLKVFAELFKGRILFVSKLDEIYDAIQNFSKVDRFEISENAFLCSKYMSVSSRSFYNKFL